jgi:hypothetical protein
MALPQQLLDAVQYLKSQLENVPEDYPGLEVNLINAWVDYINLDGDYEIEDIVYALDILKTQGYAPESIEEVIEEIQDYTM